MNDEATLILSILRESTNADNFRNKIQGLGYRLDEVKPHGEMWETPKGFLMLSVFESQNPDNICTLTYAEKDGESVNLIDECQIVEGLAEESDAKNSAKVDDTNLVGSHESSDTPEACQIVDGEEEIFQQITSSFDEIVPKVKRIDSVGIFLLIVMMSSLIPLGIYESWWLPVLLAVPMFYAGLHLSEFIVGKLKAKYLHQAKSIALGYFLNSGLNIRLLISILTRGCGRYASRDYSKATHRKFLDYAELIWDKEKDPPWLLEGSFIAGLVNQNEDEGEKIDNLCNRDPEDIDKMLFGILSQLDSIDSHPQLSGDVSFKKNKISIGTLLVTFGSLFQTMVPNELGRLYNDLLEKSLIVDGGYLKFEVPSYTKENSESTKNSSVLIWREGEGGLFSLAVTN